MTTQEKTCLWLMTILRDGHNIYQQRIGFDLRSKFRKPRYHTLKHIVNFVNESECDMDVVTCLPCYPSQSTVIFCHVWWLGDNYHRQQFLPPTKELAFYELWQDVNGSPYEHDCIARLWTTEAESSLETERRLMP